MSEISNEVLAAKIQGYQDLNSEEHKNILQQMMAFIVEQKRINDNHDVRILNIENWRIAFMAKIGVYSAVAIIIGTGLGTVAWYIIQRLLFKVV